MNDYTLHTAIIIPQTGEPQKGPKLRQRATTPMGDADGEHDRLGNAPRSMGASAVLASVAVVVVVGS
jgi:hypothetical protein